MEAGESGLYLFSACTFATLLWHPSSPIERFVPSDTVRGMLMGSAMGATIIVIVLSPWGKQSGAHFNPAVTFTFYRLGKVAVWDTVFYCASQFLGAVAGVALASFVLQGRAGARSSALRCHDTRHLRRRHRVYCRIGHLVYADERDPVRVQSQSPGALHILLCRYPGCGPTPRFGPHEAFQARTFLPHLNATASAKCFRFRRPNGYCR